MPTTAQTIGRRAILPDYLSSYQTQLGVALDTLQKFENLYVNQKKISAGWQGVYEVAERRRARADSGRIASDTLTSRVLRYAEGETRRADRADSLNAPLQKKVCKYEGCTVVGRQLRKVDRGVKYIGYTGTLYVLFRLALNLIR